MRFASSISYFLTLGFILGDINTKYLLVQVNEAPLWDRGPGHRRPVDVPVAEHFHKVTNSRSIKPGSLSKDESLTGPMRPDEIQEFVITKVKRPNCRLILGSASRTTYKVMKKQEIKLGSIYTNFFAVHSSHFTPNPDPEDFQIPQSRYIHQAGYAQCHHGWINKVETNERSNGLPFARECGIGTVLTELCLIDPDVKRNVEGNAARERIIGNPVASYLVKNHCKQLVGLQMSADPAEGAYAYFSAAIK